jgi:hypothetical protein
MGSPLCISRSRDVANKVWFGGCFDSSFHHCCSTHRDGEGISRTPSTVHCTWTYTRSTTVDVEETQSMTPWLGGIVNWCRTCVKSHFLMPCTTNNHDTLRCRVLNFRKTRSTASSAKPLALRHRLWKPLALKAIGFESQWLWKSLFRSQWLF